jgi:acyl-CoA thioesterase FadM
MSEPRASTTVDYRARFDECGPDGELRPGALLRWAQDAAWIHSGRLGFGREWYAERGLAWVVRALSLVVFAPVPMGATVAITTRVIGFRRVLARRATEIVLPEGPPAALCTTDWAITDVVTGSPARVPADFPAMFDSPPGGFEPLRVRPEAIAPDAAVTHLRTRPQELDPMAHANNATYLDWFEEAVAAAGGSADLAAGPRTYRLEYLVPAALGDELLVRTWAVGSGEDRAWRCEIERVAADDASAQVLRATLTAGEGYPP